MPTTCTGATEFDFCHQEACSVTGKTIQYNAKTQEYTKGYGLREEKREQFRLVVDGTNMQG